MRFAVIYGTRPEAVKLSKLIPLLPDAVVIRTGQHTDLADGLLQPTVDLHLPSDNDPLRYARTCEVALHGMLSKGIDAVLVQGDTASAYAGALAAHDLGLPIAHVEAGLRTGNLDDPWPEEGFRVAIDRLARWCFAPTDWAARNLELEPDHQDDREIHVTGNTGIDALYAHTQPIQAPHQTQPRVMVTLHRRESFGQPLIHIVEGLWKTAQRYPGVEFFWPVHPNPEIQKALPTVGWMRGYRGGPFEGDEQVSVPRNVHLASPLPPQTFSQMLSTSRAVLTDSGGVQEEAAALGIPCVIARDATDRPESVEAGLAIVAGRTSAGVFHSLQTALSYQLRAVPSHCFGDGHAAHRIAQVLTGKPVTVGT